MILPSDPLYMGDEPWPYVIAIFLMFVPAILVLIPLYKFRYDLDNAIGHKKMRVIGLLIAIGSIILANFGIYLPKIAMGFYMTLAVFALLTGTDPELYAHKFGHSIEYYVYQIVIGLLFVISMCYSVGIISPLFG